MMDEAVQETSMVETVTRRWFPRDGLSFEVTTRTDKDGSVLKTYAVRSLGRVILTKAEALALSRAMHAAGVFA